MDFDKIWETDVLHYVDQFPRQQISQKNHKNEKKSEFFFSKNSLNRIGNAMKPVYNSEMTLKFNVISRFEAVPG